MGSEDGRSLVAISTYLADAEPRGSLDDLGVWLGGALKDERAAFREIVRRGRARSAPTTPGSPARGHVWLPSSELLTRFSGPPSLPSASPRRSVSPRLAARVRQIGAGAMFAAALGLAGLGLVHRNGESRATAPLAERAPRSVEDTAPDTLVTTLALTSRESPVSSDVAAASEAVATELTAPPSSIPAAVLRELLPPNPYDPGD